MDKTIRQLAEEYGMTKQAMQYHIKKLPERCKNFATQKGVKILMINQEGQEILRFLLAKKQTEEVTKFGNKEIENFATKEEVLELKHKLEMKELENKSYLEKIEILEKRVEEDKERIETTLKLLDQAQQLQAIAEQKIKRLEQKTEETPDQEEPDTAEDKKWWQFWK